MAKEKDEKVKVLVREGVSVWINGKEIQVKQGMQELDPEVARILVEAGYAEEVK